MPTLALVLHFLPTGKVWNLSRPVVRPVACPVCALLAYAELLYWISPEHHETFH